MHISKDKLIIVRLEVAFRIDVIILLENLKEYEIRTHKVPAAEFL